MSVVDIGAVRRSFLRAIVDIAHIVELELLAVSLPVGIGQVVAGVERARELHARLREVLPLARDAVHVVVAHRKGVRSCLAV